MFGGQLHAVGSNVNLWERLPCSLADIQYIMYMDISSPLPLGHKGSGVKSYSGWRLFFSTCQASVEGQEVCSAFSLFLKLQLPSKGIETQVAVFDLLGLCLSFYLSLAYSVSFSFLCGPSVGFSF